jgi:hypothetical protein
MPVLHTAFKPPRNAGSAAAAIRQVLLCPKYVIRLAP